MKRIIFFVLSNLVTAVFATACIAGVYEQNCQMCHGINEKERVSVKDTVAAFYEKLCYDQGLGVAQNLVTSDSAQIAQ